ncbi:MAG: kelch repeat-containing protein [Planctomycetota bacterium]
MSIVPSTRAKRLLPLAIFVPTCLLSAQSDWSETYPMPRVEYVMEYLDPQEVGADPHLLMFGGMSDPCLFTNVGAPLGDTWLWSNGEWTRHEQADGPQRRSASAMCPAANETLLMFGGLNAGQVLNDTWRWNGLQWSLETPITSPPPRDLHAMAYDPGRNVVVMFGGTDSAQNQLNETWEWDGSNWSLIPLTSSPSAREGHVMLFCPTTGRIYMHGGWGGGYSNQLHEYVPGTQWILRANTPRAIGYHYGGYDPGTDRIVVGGGQWASGANQNGYLIDPTTFSPTLFTGHAMGFPRASRYAMAFGNPDGAGDRFHLFKGPASNPMGALQRSTMEQFNSAAGWTNSVLQRWNGPPLSHGGAMTFDESRNRLVLVTGAQYRDPAIGNFAHPCNQQNPPVGTRGSQGWSFQASGQCSSFTVQPVVFDDFKGDWAVGRTFERDAGATGVDRGWIESDAAQVPSGGSVNAGAGLGLSFVRANNRVYRLGGYTLGQVSPGAPFGSWQPLSNPCILQTGTTCMGQPGVTRHLQRYLYNPGFSFGLDSGLYEYLGPQTGQSAWNLVSTYPAGSIGFHAQYADQVQGRLVVFGGSPAVASNATADVLVFNPTTTSWATFSQPVGTTPWPTARFGHAMAYDERRNVAVMFGGWDLTSANGAMRGDTWELAWDPIASAFNWTEIDLTGTPAQRPGSRMLHSMVYDPVKQRVVLSGGIARPFLDTNSAAWPFRTRPALTSYPQALSDVWEWNGVRWEQRLPDTRRMERFSSAAAWDPGTEKVAVFGGLTHGGIPPQLFASRFEALDDFGPDILSTVSSLGFSCPTAANPLTATPGQRPYLGTQFDLNWSLPNPSITYLPVVFFGFQTQTLNLGFAGLPSCWAWITLDTSVTLGVNATQFTWGVPDMASGIGLPVYAQVGLVDVSTSNLAEVTDALRMVLQMR